MQSSGVMEVVAGIGGDFRGMYAGFSAKGAVVATLLAEEGHDRRPAFRGPYGIFNTYFGGGYEREAMLTDLGADFRGRPPCTNMARGRHVAQPHPRHDAPPTTRRCGPHS